jgi:hypothetical protein
LSIRLTRFFINASCQDRHCRVSKDYSVRDVVWDSLGVRCIGSSEFTDLPVHFEAALIGVLSYADESKRTVADVIEV